MADDKISDCKYAKMPEKSLPVGWMWAGTCRIARWIESGVVTSSQLTNAFIERIESLDAPDGINAVVVRDFEKARNRAAEADAALLRGQRWGPLHGVPITVKENNDVEGLPTTLGNSANSGQIAKADSEAVARLLAAGCVLLGKTNLALDLNDVQSYNEVYGVCRNPHKLCVTTGGSSGGSAAALAAGFTAAELGGDIGGSVRTPAHCCGVFGHKATFGIIPIGNADLVVKGVLSRHAEDLSLLLDVVAGPWGQIRRGWTLSLPPPRHSRLCDFKVAVWGDDKVCPVDDDVTSAVQRLVATLRKAGASISEQTKPEGLDTKEAFETYRQLLAPAENNMLNDDEFARALQDAAQFNESDTSELATQAKWIVQRHRDWYAANTKRQAMRELWGKFFEDYDVLVCPICCSDAWPHDHSGKTDQPFWKVGNRTIPGNGLDTAYHRQVFWAGWTNVAFNPSTCFPCGRSADGLPIGLQAVGAEFDDHTTIAFARCLAKEAEGFSFEPPSRLTELSSL